MNVQAWSLKISVRLQAVFDECVCVAAAVWEVVSVSLLWLCVFECRVDFGTLTVVIAFHGLANVYTDCLHLVSKFPRFWQVAKRDQQIGHFLLSSLFLCLSCVISPFLLYFSSPPTVNLYVLGLKGNFCTQSRLMLRPVSEEKNCFIGDWLWCPTTFLPFSS